MHHPVWKPSVDPGEQPKARDTLQERGQPIKQPVEASDHPATFRMPEAAEVVR